MLLLTMQVVALSGGKDSVAMLLRMVELGEEIDKVIYVDSDWEFPEVRETVKQVGMMIDKEIDVLWADFNYWMFDRIRQKGNNKGTVGYGWPTPRFRWCSGLKRWLLDKAVRGNGEVIKCLGMAFDEQFRLGLAQTKKIKNRYPLVEWEWTQEDNMRYCKERGVDFGGFYERYTRTGCWCCPLQNQTNMYALYKYYPHLWAKMEEMDSISLNPFNHGHSVEYYGLKFKAMGRQTGVDDARFRKNNEDCESQ
jgi:3'-phosphoadenosine 5'-phosphosulfate sulfotransferase (PAPS reductase)/FAD synthetase